MLSLGFRFTYIGILGDTLLAGIEKLALEPIVKLLIRGRLAAVGLTPGICVPEAKFWGQALNCEADCA